MLRFDCGHQSSKYPSLLASSVLLRATSQLCLALASRGKIYKALKKKIETSLMAENDSVCKSLIPFIKEVCRQRLWIIHRSH